jgi:hypothetical protein
MENHTFLFVTNPDKHPQRVTVRKTLKWSCTRKTAKGDHALVYVNGEGISYEWIAVTKAERSTKSSKWPYCCEVKLVKNFDPPINLSELQDAIPQKDWNAPHCNMRVKAATIIRDDVAEKVRALRKSLTIASAPPANDAPDEVPPKIRLTINRFIRDTKMTQVVKEKYKNRCQVCGKRIKIKRGVFYSEAHHLKPLGGGHKGSDAQDNILCLCPNHHALFDYFAIPLDPAKLRLNKHKLRQTFVDYHNVHFCLRQV